MRVRRIPLIEPLAGAWYVFCALVLTWPVASTPTSRLIGDPVSGVWRNVWAHEWTRTRLLQDGRWPLTAPEIGFPSGGAFHGIAPLNDLFSLPLQPLIGAVGAYNLLFVFHMLLAATGAHALARITGAGRLGAVVAGTVFGFNSFVLSYGGASAVVETTTAGWVAWFAVAVVALLRRPRPLMGVTAGFLFAACGISSLYWAVVAAFASLVLAAAMLLRRRRAGLVVVSWPMALWTGVSIAVAAVVFLPLASAMLGTYSDAGALLAGYSLRKQQLLLPSVMAGLAHDHASLAGYLLAGREHLARQEDLDLLMQTTYAGWVAVVVGLLGYRRGTRRWMWLLVLGVVLSIGPFVFITPESFRSTPVSWWLALREWVPPLRMVTSYVRFCLLAYLGLGLLAAAGADGLARRVVSHRRRRWRVAIPAAVAVGVLLETLLLSPADTPIPTAEVYYPQSTFALAELPSSGAVLDWPQHHPGRRAEVSRYFLYQGVHGRPIAYDFAPTGYQPGPIESNPFYAELEVATYGVDYRSEAWGPVSLLSPWLGLYDLHRMGFEYLVLHPEFVSAERRDHLVRWLDAWLARVETLSDGGIIYRVAAPLPGAG